MSDWMLLYAFTRLDALGALFGAASAACAAGIWAGCMFGFVGNKPAGFVWAKVAGVGLALSALLAAAIPSRADMAIIVGGKIALDASRTDTAKEIGGEVLDAIRAQLKKAAQ